MRAILLAAGLGTRLRPLTHSIPKSLVPINGVPLLEIWLERLSSSGIGPFLINTHYKQDQVEEFISHSRFAKAVTIVHEPNLLGTAGTLRANRNFFRGEDGMLIHADNFCLADFRAFTTAHTERASHCLLTMMTFFSPNPHECGIVETDERGVVQKFYEKVENPPGNLANAAIYTLANQLIDNLPDGDDFSKHILPACLGKIQTFCSDDPLIDVGTYDRYMKANEVAKEHGSTG